MASRARAVLWVIGLAVVAAGFWAEAQVLSTLVWEGRKAVPWVVAVGLPIGLYVLAAAVSESGLVRFVAGCVGLAAGVFLLVWSAYQNDRSYLVATRVVSTPVAELAPRAPYLVGKAQAGTSLGDIAGDVSDVTFLPDVDRFATLVERRGWFSGYQTGFVQRVPLTGRGADEQRCDFDTSRATARLGGHLGHNLARAIHRQDRWVRYEQADAYVYCGPSGPVVVVPLKRQVGLFGIAERPAGVALYDGRTGTLRITADTRDLPGPSYPISLAERQRSALVAEGSFTDWLSRRGGWVRSDDGTNDENESEFALARADGSGSVYVTPLTPRGTTSSITAVSEVPARYSGYRLAPLTVHRLAKPWLSPQAIVARVTSDYRDVCCYNGDQVFEVIPTGGDSWVASMGSEQNITYRLRGNGQLSGPEATCLLTADGTVVRCGSYATATTQQQSTTEPTGSSTSAAATGPPVPSGDLSTLSDQQLADLQRRVADEVARRLERR